VATVPDSSGVIHACLQVAAKPGGVVVPAPGPNLQVIDPSAKQTCSDPAGGATPADLVERLGAAGPARSARRHGPGGHGHRHLHARAPAGQGDRTPEGGVVLGTGRSAIKFQFLGFAFAATGGGTGGHGGGGGTGKSVPHEITITKAFDKYSPQLLKLSLIGKHIPQATITLVKKTGGNQKYVEFTLKEVFIVSVQEGSTHDGKSPLETLTLSFASETEKYFK
jgi:Type VI secretion system effector, Hcp